MKPLLLEQIKKKLSKQADFDIDFQKRIREIVPSQHIKSATINTRRITITTKNKVAAQELYLQRERISAELKKIPEYQAQSLEIR